MKVREAKDKIIWDIINFWTGFDLSDNYSQNEKQIFKYAIEKVLGIQVEPDGPTLKQEKEMDRIFSEAANEILLSRKRKAFTIVNILKKNVIIKK